MLQQAATKLRKKYSRSQEQTQQILSEHLNLHVKSPIESLASTVESVDERTEKREVDANTLLKSVESLQECITAHRKEGFISHEEHISEVFDIEERYRRRMAQSDLLITQSQAESIRLSSALRKMSDQTEMLEGMLSAAEEISETDQKAAEMARNEMMIQSAEFDTLNKAVETLQEDLEDKTDELVSMTDSHTRQSSQVALLQSELEAAKTQGRELLGENAKYAKEVSGLKYQIDGIKGLNDQVADLTGQLTDKTELISLHERSLGDLESQLKLAAERNEGLVKENGEKTRQIADHARQQTLLTSLSKENQTLTGMLQKTERSLKDARTETERLSGVLEKAESNLTTLRNEHEKRASELEASKSRVDTLQTESTSKSDELSSLRVEVRGHQELTLQMKEKEEEVIRLREQIARHLEIQGENDRLKDDCKTKDTIIQELKDKVTELEQDSPIIPDTLQVLATNSLARSALLDEVFLPYPPDALEEQDTTTTTHDAQATVADDRPTRRRADRGGFRGDEVQVQATAELNGPNNRDGDQTESSFVPDSQIYLPFGTQIPLATPLGECSHDRDSLGPTSFENNTPMTESQRGPPGTQSIGRAPSTSSQVDAMLLDSLDSSEDCHPTRSLRKRKTDLMRDSFSGHTQTSSLAEQDSQTTPYFGPLVKDLSTNGDRNVVVTTPVRRTGAHGMFLSPNAARDKHLPNSAAKRRAEPDENERNEISPKRVKLTVKLPAAAYRLQSPNKARTQPGSTVTGKPSSAESFTLVSDGTRKNNLSGGQPSSASKKKSPRAPTRRSSRSARYHNQFSQIED